MKRRTTADTPRRGPGLGAESQVMQHHHYLLLLLLLVVGRMHLAEMAGGQQREAGKKKETMTDGDDVKESVALDTITKEIAAQRENTEKEMKEGTGVVKMITAVGEIGTAIEIGGEREDAAESAVRNRLALYCHGMRSPQEIRLIS